MRAAVPWVFAIPQSNGERVYLYEESEFEFVIAIVADIVVPVGARMRATIPIPFFAGKGVWERKKSEQDTRQRKVITLITCVRELGPGQ